MTALGMRLIHEQHEEQFHPKKGQELWQKVEEYEQCEEYDEVFFQLDHFAKRYLGKLDNIQCHRNVTELETHIEYIQEHYQIEKF